MPYIASITSQGQVTIPKKVRSKYGLLRGGKVVLEDEGSHLKLTTFSDDDFFSLYGILKDNPKLKTNKGKSIDAVMAEEDEAFEQAIVDSAAKGKKY